MEPSFCGVISEMQKNNEIVIFETEDKQIKLPVTVEGETVWLNRNQMSELFDRDVKTIGKHINNALKEELSADNSTVAKFATVQLEGEREVERHIEYYSLDVIISVGYRVKSKRGVEFRRWANSVLKQYIIKGYAVNKYAGCSINKQLHGLIVLHFHFKRSFPILLKIKKSPDRVFHHIGHRLFCIECHMRR